MAAVNCLEGFSLVLHRGPGVAEFRKLLHLSREEGRGLREDFVVVCSFVVCPVYMDGAGCADAVAYKGGPFD